MALVASVWIFSIESLEKYEVLLLIYNMELFFIYI